MSSQELLSSDEKTILNQSFSTNEFNSSFRTVEDENSQDQIEGPVAASELNVMFSHLYQSL